MYVWMRAQTTVDQFGTRGHCFAHLIATQQQFDFGFIAHPGVLGWRWPEICQRVYIGTPFNFADLASYCPNTQQAPPNARRPRTILWQRDRPAIWPMLGTSLCNLWPAVRCPCAILISWLDWIPIDRPTIAWICHVPLNCGAPTRQNWPFVSFSSFTPWQSHGSHPQHSQ